MELNTFRRPWLKKFIAFAGSLLFVAVVAGDQTYVGMPGGGGGSSAIAAITSGTISGVTLSASTVTATGLTAGQSVYTGTGGLLSSGTGVTYDGTTWESSKQTNISGPDATTNVEIGSTANDANAGTGGTAIAIGNSVTNSGNGAGSISIGTAVTISATGGNNKLIGETVSLGGAGAASNTIIGNSMALSTTGNNNLMIANSGTMANNPANSICLGPLVACDASNAFEAGGDGFPISDLYFGDGRVSTSATDYTIHGGGGSGANNAGGAVKISGGFGTGTAAGGDVSIQRSSSIATGSTAQTASDAYYIRSQKKGLTAATATPFVRINLAAGAAAVTGWTGGTVFYSLVVDDGTDFQTRSGHVDFAVVNKAGTETCTLGTGSVEAAASSSVATTTLTLDTDTAGPTNGCDIRATAASTLVETTLALYYSVVLNGPGTLSPQ